MITPEEQKTAADELAVLTPREREALVLLSKGLSHADAAAAMGLGKSTVDNLATSMHRQLKMTTIEAAVLAAKAGWV